MSISAGHSSSSSSGPQVWSGQQPFLKDLWAQSQGLAQRQMGGGGQGSPTGWNSAAGQGDANGRKWAGGGMFGNSGYGGQPGAPAMGQGGGGGQFGPAGSIGDYSSQLVGALMNQNNPQLSQQIQGLGADIGQFYNQQVMPGIANDAGGYGQFGGARQGIAQGMAAQDATRQFSQGATALRSASYENQGTRANQLYNLGMQPWQAQWSPLQAYGQLVGGPHNQGGSSRSFSYNSSFGL